MHNYSMNKILLLALLVTSSSLYAADDEITVKDPSVTPSISYDVDENRTFNPRESHWLMTLGMEGLKYPVDFNFTGDKEQFRPKDQDLYGGRLGFGGEIYLGKGLFTTSKAEVYYNGIINTQTQNAGPENVDVSVAFVKRTGQVWGLDLSQSIGWMFDFKTKNPFMGDYVRMTFEPFVEAGLGWGQAINRLHYSYTTTVVENYKYSVEDTLVNARLAAGFNITGFSGFFMFAKAAVNRYEITDRKTKGYVQQNGGSQTAIPDSNDKPSLDPIVVYTLGGGYKF